ncbi:hypothetical protein LINPERHAP1_LOCUS23297 [Linum perenne]
MDKEPEAESGSWMTVRRRSKGKTNKQRPPETFDKREPTASRANKGSRFTILQPEKVLTSQTKPQASRGPKVTATQVADQAENLIHSMVELTNKIFSKGDNQESDPKAIPLGDITNKELDTGNSQNDKSQTPLKQDGYLFSVPISYDNPIFEGVTQVHEVGATLRGTKDKGKTARRVTLARAALEAIPAYFM